MNTIAATLRPIPFPSMARLRSDPVAQAFTLLRIGFFVLPVLMGIDKFAEVMNENWTAYLATEFNDILPGSAQDAMYAVGVVEILAGIIVLVIPRFGGLLVAAWLGGIIVSLLLAGGYGDIALRDVGLLLGALTLFRLAGAESGDSGIGEPESGDSGIGERVNRGQADETDPGAAGALGRDAVA